MNSFKFQVIDIWQYKKVKVQQQVIIHKAGECLGFSQKYYHYTP